VTTAKRLSHDESRILAELSLSVLVAAEDTRLADLAAVAIGVASELVELPPLGVVLDAAYILLAPVVRLDEARARLLTELPIDGELSRAVTAAFDAFVAPLAASQAATDLRDALMRHPHDARLRGAAIVIAEILSRNDVRGARGPRRSLDVGTLRRVIVRPAAELRARGAAAILSEPLRLELAERYDDFARRCRMGARLVTTGDRLIAENAPALAKRAARVALAQVADASDAIAKKIPRNVGPRRPRGGDVATRAADESAYPMGGFASMSNVGSIESVVSSELAFSDPTAELTEDLFTVRWALGELLYYTRDESVATRRRTTLSISFGADLESARIKDRGSPFQRLILAIASAAVFVERALYVLREESVRVVLWFEGVGLEPERRLAELAFVREAAAGLLEARAVQDGAGVESFESEEREHARVVSVRYGASPPARDPSRVDTWTVTVAERPELDQAPHPQAQTPHPQASTTRDVLEAWAEVTRGLLQRL
jgi:hypothetical protein